MNKKALKARAAALQTELNALNAELAKPELPEGFTPFISTPRSQCPCHPEDRVNGVRKDGAIITDWLGSQFNWALDSGLDNSIIGYKVVRKHVETHPIKYREIPVGTTFLYTGDNETYIKKSMYESVALTGAYKGCVASESEFSDSQLFYAVESSFETGSRLTVENP